MSGDGRTVELLRRVREGQAGALDELFGTHREALRRGVELRLDRRLLARLDASDVVQEAFLEAAKRLPDYLKDGVLPFHLWLRRIARDAVVDLHRRHFDADRRSVRHEMAPLPLDSSVTLMRGLAARGATPSQELAAAESAEGLRRALESLGEDDREVILLRHMEGLTSSEVAELLGISEDAAAKRYLRAIDRLRAIVAGPGRTAG